MSYASATNTNATATTNGTGAGAGAEVLGGRGPSLKEAFEDLETRFILNLPDAELQTPERLFFQVEQAWWFYEDFVADKYGHLPHYKDMETFARKLFIESPILNEYIDKLDEWHKVFKDYMQRIPVYGAIMLNPEMTHVLMVTGYHRNTWGFPKGKVNQDEPDLECAVREVYEEVGYAILPENVSETDYLKHTNKTGKLTKLFIARHTPQDFDFHPRVRKEIGRIEWKELSKLPTCIKDRKVDAKYWNIFQFVEPLKKWILRHKKIGKRAGTPKKQADSRANSRAKTRGDVGGGSGNFVPHISAAGGQSVAHIAPSVEVVPYSGNLLESGFSLDRQRVFNAMDAFLVAR